MAFLEKVVARVFMAVFDRVWALVQSKVDKSMDYQKIYEKHDQAKNEMILELEQARTPEERDAILVKIYNSRPKFE